MPKENQTERKHKVQAQLSNVELVKAKSSLQLDVYASKEKSANWTSVEDRCTGGAHTARPVNGSAGHDSQT